MQREPEVLLVMPDNYAKTKEPGEEVHWQSSDQNKAAIRAQRGADTMRLFFFSGFSAD